ncbi:unnamed protein product [Mytilus edulis]|uniref:DZIP3-like HEPN domain-containing protein n=1 Tax=Mytilus edulis TaxID=6550 RepID=A0A8S3RDJ5_MYTED|nr:unnamed protein product [Mytilus edulis]
MYRRRSLTGSVLKSLERGNQMVKSLVEGCSNESETLAFYGPIILFDIFLLILNSGSKTVPVFMQIQVPSDWDTAKLVDSIEVMCAQYTSDMPVKITSFSTEDVEILAEIWKLIMTKAGSLQKEIRRFIHELVTLSGIRAQNEQLDIKIIMDEEETKRGAALSEDPVGRQIFQIDRQIELSALPVINRGVLIEGNNIIYLLSKKTLFKYHIIDCKHSGIDLQSDSHDLAVMNESIIAITVPETKNIELHNVKRNDKDVRYISTDRWCYAISVTTSDYVVVCMNSKNKGLKFINIRDNQSIEHMQNVKVHQKDGLFFSSPYLYYTNYTNKYIACYNDDRKLHFTFEDKPFPYPPIGMTMIDNDTLYIVCETSNKILHVSISKKRHKPVESGFESVIKPCVVLFSESTRKLFILDNINNLFVYEQIQSTK